MELMSQSTSTNSTTITVDRRVDGKIVQEIFEIEGSGADDKLEALKKDDSIININVEKRVEMRSDDSNDRDIQHLRKEVEVEISEIEDLTGTISERREENIEIEITADDHKEIKRYRLKIIEDGKEELIEWDGQGEMPEKMKEVMQNTDINVLDNRDESYEYDNSLNIHSQDDTKERNTNRGEIGVMVSNAIGGVEIVSFTDDSRAKNAGLLIGDVINGVNGRHVGSMVELVDALKQYVPGDVVTIHYIRGRDILTAQVGLNKR